MMQCSTFRRNYLHAAPRRRFVMDLRALQQIRKEQKTTDAVIRFNTMRKIVKEMISPKRVAKNAVNAILESVADLVPAIFRNAAKIARNSGRVTVMKDDVSLAYDIMVNPVEQEKADAVIPFKAMRRIVKKMIAPKRVTKKAVDTVIESVGGLVHAIFHNAANITKNGKRVTVGKDDFMLAYDIMRNPINSVCI